MGKRNYSIVPRNRFLLFTTKSVQNITQGFFYSPLLGYHFRRKILVTTNRGLAISNNAIFDNVLSLLTYTIPTMTQVILTIENLFEIAIIVALQVPYDLLKLFSVTAKTI